MPSYLQPRLISKTYDTIEVISVANDVFYNYVFTLAHLSLKGNLFKFNIKTLKFVVVSVFLSYLGINRLLFKIFKILIA
jgi:hypothetical protein